MSVPHVCVCVSAHSLLQAASPVQNHKTRNPKAPEPWTLDPEPLNPIPYTLNPYALDPSTLLLLQVQFTMVLSGVGPSNFDGDTFCATLVSSTGAQFCSLVSVRPGHTTWVAVHRCVAPPPPRVPAHIPHCVRGASSGFHAPGHLNPPPSTLDPPSSTLDPPPFTLHPPPSTLHPKPCIMTLPQAFAADLSTSTSANTTGRRLSQTSGSRLSTGVGLSVQVGRGEGRPCSRSGVVCCR